MQSMLLKHMNTINDSLSNNRMRTFIDEEITNTAGRMRALRSDEGQTLLSGEDMIRMLCVDNVFKGFRFSSFTNDNPNILNCRYRNQAKQMGLIFEMRYGLFMRGKVRTKGSATSLIVLRRFTTNADWYAFLDDWRRIYDTEVTRAEMDLSDADTVDEFN